MICASTALAADTHWSTRTRSRALGLLMLPAPDVGEFEVSILLYYDLC
jgi:hypothetical protein